MKQSLREHILMAQIFAPDGGNSGQHVNSILLEVETLLDWTQSEVEEEISSMESGGLIKRYDDSRFDGYWKSTEAGRSERESLFRRMGWRAACLCNPGAWSLEDLVLALAAAPRTCRRHIWPPSESRLALHFFDYKSDLDNCTKALETQGLVTRQEEPGTLDSGRVIRITPSGLREYRNVIAPRLGIHDGLCILDEQPRAALDGASLVALGFKQELVDILDARAKEARECESIGAYLAATALYGSVLEGVLYGLASAKPSVANSSPKAPKKSGSVKKLGEWTLQQYVGVGVDVGWIPKSMKGYANQLRDSRNLIHAKKQIDDGVEADAPLAKMTKEVLNSVLEHIASIP